MKKLGGALLAGLVCLSPLWAQQEDLRSIEKDLKQGLKAQAEREVEKAVQALHKINTPEAVKVLLRGLRERLLPSTYWILVRGAAAFSSPDALGEVTGYILKYKQTPVARDMAAALHGNWTPACEGALIAILNKGTPELQALATEHLMEVGARDAVEAVLALLKKGRPGPDLSRRLFRVLSVITIGDYGDSLSNWEGWWEANKHKDWGELKAKEGPGYRSGGGTVTDSLDKARDKEVEQLKKGKVLVLGAGNKCKDGKNHDLDRIDSLIKKMDLQVDFIDKIEFCKPSFKVDDYLSILCNCTFIEEHCICPTCKRGPPGDKRRFQ
ncbi:MAG: hypothetical protein HY716_12140 [Planctomycetes bacterium]|nr:hypothetical protein [Planctomycetota bacterium]